MLIVLEGLDGAGKSHQFQLLTQYLISKGYTCDFLHFPRVDIAPFGILISNYLRGQFGSLSEVNPYLIATLYANDQYLGMKDLPLEGKKHIVLLDRYYYSNLAYQTSRLHREEEKHQFRTWLEEVLGSFCMPQPQVAIYLHTPAEFRGKNLQKRSEIDIHEQNMSYQEIVHGEYLRMCEMKWHNLHALSCSTESHTMADPNIIHEKIVSLIAAQANI